MKQIIVGKHSIKEALASPTTTIDKLVISTHLKQKKDCQAIVEQAKEQQTKIQWLPPQVMQQTYDDATKNQGMVAHLLDVSFYPIEKVLNDPSTHNKILILDHIQDPHNFGAILRSCDCFGVKTVIFSKDRQAQPGPTVSKTSAGAMAHINLVRVTNLHQTIKKLKQNGFWVYGTSLSNAQNLQSTSFNQPCVIIIGNEQKGMSKVLEKECDELVYIEMEGNIQSLNASVSAGIVLYKLSQSLDV